MSEAGNEHFAAETRKQIADLERLGFYHSIRLPDGSVLQGLQSLGQLERRLAKFQLPPSLRGKRVLDIGAWDGWFSFEMERRGADVVALDCVENPRFATVRDLMQSRVKYEIGDICRITPDRLGQFDIVLCLGVLYHLKHPLLALEKICGVTKQLLCLESYVIDDGEKASAAVMEFYEGVELRGQFDNWVGPNTSCLLALARAAGFARVELIDVVQNRASVACQRSWPSVNADGPAPQLICVENSVSRDQSFSTHRDDYVSFWFKSVEGSLNCDRVFVEIGGFAARPVQVVNTGEMGWLTICKLPPGLSPGFHASRLRTPASSFCGPLEIPVDVFPESGRSGRELLHDVEITLVTDGKNWERWRVYLRTSGCLSIWARGLTDSILLSEIRVAVGSVVLPALFVSRDNDEGVRQINAMTPGGLSPGIVSLRLLVSDRESPAVNVELLLA